MKKFWYITLLFLCVFAVSSCDDNNNDDHTYDEWKTENEAAIREIAANPEYTEMKSLGNDGSIYYKVLKKGAGQKTIYYNSTVKAYYTGWFITGDKFDQAEPPYEAAVTFSVQTSTSTVSGVIAGWTTALQHMHVGDRWEVWIPYQLAYGNTGKYNSTTQTYDILPYSALKFEMEVKEIVQE